MASASGGPLPTEGRGVNGVKPKTTANKNKEETNKEAAAAAGGRDKEKVKGKKYADITKKKGDNWLPLNMFREDNTIMHLKRPTSK